MKLGRPSPKLLTAAALATLALAALAAWGAGQARAGQDNQGRRPVALFAAGPYTCANGRHSKINVVAPNDGVNRKVKLVFEIFEAEPPVAPAPPPKDNVDPSDPSSCTTYKLIARHECEANLGPSDGASLSLSHANLPPTALIRAAVTSDQFTGGVSNNLTGAVEVTGNDGSIELINLLAFKGGVDSF